ncbi:hypothetical protein [Taylorella equigenitalis]|nr:hypothetical protein [Taylorella equigenitalis]
MTSLLTGLVNRFEVIATAISSSHDVISESWPRASAVPSNLFILRYM